jgi:sugar lactone lactonase YvrE
MPPQCLAVDRDGRLFVGMADHVEVFNAQGVRESAWTSLGEKAFITAVAVTETDVFVADSGYKLVWRFDKAGKLLGRIGEKGSHSGVEGFHLPGPHLDLALAADGNLWVNNPGRLMVESYAPDGRRLAGWGSPSMKLEGFCGCCNPVSIAILPDGTFVTAEKGMPRVKRYAADGAFRGVVAGSERFEPGTDNLDVAVDPTGRILVLDPKRGMVLVFVAHPGASR